MPDISLELSTAGFPVPVQIALALAVVISILAILAWVLLARASAKLQTPAEVRDVRRVRWFLLYLIPFVLGLAVVVSALFVALETWNSLRSPPDFTPEQREGDSARLDYFPSEKDQQASPYGGSGGVTDSAD